MLTTQWLLAIIVVTATSVGLLGLVVGVHNVRISNLEWLITEPVKKLAHAYREQEEEMEQQMHRTYGLQPRGLAPTSWPVVSRPLARRLAETPADPWGQNGHQRSMSEDMERMW